VAPQDPSVSLERIRRALEKPPGGIRWDAPINVPVATFRTRVEQRQYMLTFDEWLKKEFELTDLQRQAADWAAFHRNGVVFAASGSYGIRLDPIFDKLGQMLERRKIRQITRQIDRELAALEAARKKAAAADPVR
jgi:hypothetical protein